MPNAIAASPPVTASLPPARSSLGPAPKDDPDVEYFAEFGELWQNPDDGMTFGDFLDIINPLQHIPVISSIYRMVTGDEIGVGSRLVGGALFAGIPGLIAGALSATVESASGSSIEDHILALLNDDGPGADPAAQQVAAAAGARPAARDPEPAAPGAVAAGGPATAAPAARAADAPLFTAKPAAAVRTGPAAAPVRPAETPPPAAPAPDASGEARAEKRAAERRRIAETLARARAQETALLLANLTPAPAEAAKTATEKGTPARHGIAAARPAAGAPPAAAQTPISAHPFMLPPGASPEQVSRAMEQALNKYRLGLRARGAAR